MNEKDLHTQSNSHFFQMSQYQSQGIPGSQRFNRLWIGGLPRNVAIDDVKAEVNRVYGSFGPVADVCVITTARDVMCFVQYEDEKIAFRAREDTNGKTILGSLIKVNYAVVRGPDVPRGQHGQGSQSPSRREKKDPNRKLVIVGNLPSAITSDELYESVRLVTPKVDFCNVWTDDRRTFGLMTFDTSREAAKAKKLLHGSHFEGRHDRALVTYSFTEFNESRRKSARSGSNSRDRRSRR